MRFDKPEARAARELILKGGPVRPAMPGDVLPVIHARAFELGIVEAEAQWFDQMQRRLRRGAEARDVAGVRRNFGFEQDDVHWSVGISGRKVAARV